MSDPFTSNKSPVFGQAPQQETEPATVEPEPITAEYEEVDPADKLNEIEVALSDAIDDQTTNYRYLLGLITPNMLARIIGVDVQTLKRYRNSLRGPDYLRIGKRVWYQLEDVRNWLPTQRVVLNPKEDSMTEQKRDYKKDEAQTQGRMTNPQPAPAEDTPKQPPQDDLNDPGPIPPKVPEEGGEVFYPEPTPPDDQPKPVDDEGGGGAGEAA